MFALVLVNGASFAAEMERGIVVVGERGCEKRGRIVINTNNGFVIAEVYTGIFDKGDRVIGDLKSYGLHDVLVNNSTGSVYIDDYWVSKSRAVAKCFER
jgi:hypothetical protein